MRRITAAIRAGMTGAGIALVFSLFAAAPGRAEEPIRIGDINSYTRLPAFTIPYRQGSTLALEEINAAGGVLGRPLEIVSRDDGGDPGDAVRIAGEMVTRDGVVMLSGSFFSHVGLAVSSWAARNRVLYLAAEPLSDALVWSAGNRYTFRLRPSTWMQAAMLAREAATHPATRWATIAPNYAYGTDAVEAFKAVLSELRPDVEFVAEQYPALFGIDAGAEVQALARAAPEAIFNVTFGADLGRFVREGDLRGLFEDRLMVGLLTGEPEYLDPLGEEAPAGWLVTGYPWYAIDTPAHNAFRAAYEARWDDYPRAGALVGYNTVMAIAAGLERAGGTETEALVDAFEGLTFASPMGDITFREIDHQSTMGAWVGYTAVEDGRGVMADWFQADGADYLPDDATVRALRPAE